MKYLLVEVDTNDADYIEKMKPVTEGQLSLLRPLFAAIKAFKPYTYKNSDNGYEWKHHHNFPVGDILRSDLGEKSPEELYPDHAEAVMLLQDDFLPTGEYGCHTVQSIRVLTITADERLV